MVSHKRHDRLPDGRFASLGGFAKVTRQFAREVTQLRLCVPVGEDGDEPAAVNYPSNLVICPLPPFSGRLGLLRRLPRIVTILWAEIGRANLVYAMGPNDMGLLGLVIARLRGKRFFLSVDTDRAGKARLQGGAKGKIKAWMIDHTIYPLLRRLGAGRPTYVTGDLFLGDIPNWKQWIKTTITTDELPGFQEPDSAPSTAIQVIFVGRLSREKNVECLIDAAALLARDGRDVAVWVVGGGPRRPALEARTRERAPGLVAFLGSIPNDELRNSRFLGADVLVLPSREERQGKVLLEAMACSLPVAAANAGGIPSVLTNEHNGLLFNPDSPADLAHCLSRIADQPLLRRRLVTNGYALAASNTLDRSVAGIMDDVRAFYHLPHGSGDRGNSRG